MFVRIQCFSLTLFFFPRNCFFLIYFVLLILKIGASVFFFFFFHLSIRISKNIIFKEDNKITIIGNWYENKDVYTRCVDVKLCFFLLKIESKFKKKRIIFSSLSLSFSLFIVKLLEFRLIRETRDCLGKLMHYRITQQV